MESNEETLNCITTIPSTKMFLAVNNPLKLIIHETNQSSAGSMVMHTVSLMKEELVTP